MTQLQLAKTTAKQAGKELKKRFYSRKFSTQLKSKHEIVTTADKLAEKIIIAGIKKQFPDHAILAEESGRNKNKSNYLWIIDPLDGTTNFFMHNPLFSVSIGLAYKNEILLGVVYVPILDELYYAEKGKGAFVNGKRIKVSQTNEIKDTFLTFCHGNKITALNTAINFYGKLKKTARDFRQLGSAAIECAYVARGITDAIVIPGVKSWDVAAGTILVSEAGGKVVDLKGKEWTIKSNDILATNGKIEKPLLKLIKT
jgi:myo-inositol-1(or 4)-monophosphatase